MERYKKKFNETEYKVANAADAEKAIKESVNAVIKQWGDTNRSLEFLTKCFFYSLQKNSEVDIKMAYKRITASLKDYMTREVQSRKLPPLPDTVNDEHQDFLNCKKYMATNSGKVVTIKGRTFTIGEPVRVKGDYSVGISSWDGLLVYVDAHTGYATVLDDEEEIIDEVSIREIEEGRD